MPDMTIHLPEEKLQCLRQNAAVQNKSTAALVEEAIDAYLPRPVSLSLADVLGDYIGVIDGPCTDSSRLDETFNDILQKKKSDGHL